MEEYAGRYDFCLQDRAYSTVKAHPQSQLTLYKSPVIIPTIPIHIHIQTFSQIEIFILIFIVLCDRINFSVIQLNLIKFFLPPFSILDECFTILHDDGAVK